MHECLSITLRHDATLIRLTALSKYLPSTKHQHILTPPHTPSSPDSTTALYTSDHSAHIDPITTHTFTP